MNPHDTTGNSYDAGIRSKENSQFVQNTSAGDFFDDDVAKAIHGRLNLSGPPTPSPEPSELLSSTPENKKKDIQNKETEKEAETEGNQLREIEVPKIKIMSKRDGKKDGTGGISGRTQPNHGKGENGFDDFVLERETGEANGRALSETRRGEIVVDEDNENDGKSRVGRNHGFGTTKDNLRKNEAEEEDNGSEVSYPTSLDDDDDDDRQQQQRRFEGETTREEQQRSHAAVTKEIEKKGSDKEINRRFDLDWDHDKEKEVGGDDDRDYDEDKFMLDGGESFAIFDLDLEEYDYEEARSDGGQENVRDSFGGNSCVEFQETKAGEKNSETAERANTTEEKGEPKEPATGDVSQVGEQAEQVQQMDPNERVVVPHSYASRHSPAKMFGSTHLRRKEKENLARRIAVSSALYLENRQANDAPNTITLGNGDDSNNTNSNDVAVKNTTMTIADKKDEQIGIDIEGIQFDEIRETDPFVLVDDTFETFCARVSSGAGIDKTATINDTASSGGIHRPPLPTHVASSSAPLVRAKPTSAEFAENMLREYTAKWREEERSAREIAKAKAKAKAAAKAKEAAKATAAREETTDEVKINKNDGKGSEEKLAARHRPSTSEAAATPPLRNPSEKVIAKVPTTRPSDFSNRPSSPTTRRTFNGFDLRELMREARDAYESKFKKERRDEREMRHQLREERQHYAHLKGKEASLRETYEEKGYFRELANHSQTSAPPLAVDSSRQNVGEKFACGDTFLSELINERMREAALDAIQKCRKQREDRLGDSVDGACGGQEGQQQQEEPLTGRNDTASAKMPPANDELLTLLTPLNLSFAGSAASTTANFYEKDLTAKAGSATGSKSNKLRTVIPPPRTSSIASLLESDLYQKMRQHGEYLHKPRVELYTSAQNARFTATGWFGKGIDEAQQLGGAASKKAAAWAYTCGPLEIVKKEKKTKLILSSSSVDMSPLLEDQSKEKGMVNGDLDTAKTSEDRGENQNGSPSDQELNQERQKPTVSVPPQTRIHSQKNLLPTKSSEFLGRSSAEIATAFTLTAAPIGELPNKKSLSDPTLVTNKQIAHAPPSLRRLLYEHYNMDVHSRYAYLQKNDEEQEGKEELGPPLEGKQQSGEGTLDDEAETTNGAPPSSEHKIDVNTHQRPNDEEGAATEGDDAEHFRRPTEKRQLPPILIDAPCDQEVTTIVLNAFAPGVDVSDSNKIEISTPPPKPTTDLSTAILLAKHRPICPFTNANQKETFALGTKGPEKSQSDLHARRSSPSRRDGAVSSTILKKSKSSEIDAPPPPSRSRSKSMRAEDSFSGIKTSTNEEKEKRSKLKSSTSTSSVSETLPKKRQRSMSRAVADTEASSPLASSHASFSSATFSPSPSRSSSVLNSSLRRKKDTVAVHVHVVAPTNDTPENTNNNNSKKDTSQQQQIPDFELITDRNDGSNKDKQRVSARKGKAGDVISKDEGNTCEKRRKKVNLTGYISGEDSNEDEQDVITTFTVVGLKRNQEKEIPIDGTARSILHLENEHKTINLAAGGILTRPSNERPSSLPDNRGAMISLLPQIPSYAALNTEKAQKCYQDLLTYIHSQYKYTKPSTNSSVQAQGWGVEGGGGKKAATDNRNNIAKAVNLAERSIILEGRVGRGPSLHHRDDVDGFSAPPPPPSALMPPFGMFPTQTYEY